MKNSEPIVYEYLQKWCPSVKYEVTVGSANPDFSIWNEKNQCTAFWDVADREFTNSDAEELSRRLIESDKNEIQVRTGMSPETQYVINKIGRKSAQFEKSGIAPGMVVLAEWAGILHISGTDVSIAFEGWPQIKLNLGSAQTDISFARSPDGRMTSPRHFIKNSFISAVGLVRRGNIDKHKSGLISFANRTLERFGLSQYSHNQISKKSVN